MHKEILISAEPQEKRVAILKGGLLEEFYVERPTVQRLVGNIYKGKVESIAAGIGAAFVNTGLAKSGFLYISDVEGISPELEENVELLERANPKTQHTKIEDLVKKGQDIMAQITKEPFGTKGARLTTKISLPGRYLVLMPTDSHIGISKRIDDPQERNRLRQILQQLRIPKDMGVIIRTAGTGRSKKDFIRDLHFLFRLYRRIKAGFSRQKAPALLHQEHSLVFRIVRDIFTEEVDKLIVDSKPEYREIVSYTAQLMPDLRSRIQFYTDNEPLFDKKHVESQVEKIYDRKVELKGGGYLIIERTESLVAIDVNTGSYIGRRDVEDTVFAVNMMAAKEVARQIKLRDLGGIIVIDFIDMKSSEHRKKVYRLLEEEVKSDKAKTNILQISELGLVQMTRQRSRKPVESLVYQVCPYCQGKGATRSSLTMAITAIRKAKAFLYANKGARRIEIAAHPDVASRFLKEDKGSLVYLQKRYRAAVSVKPDPSLHIEQVGITRIA